MPESLAPCDLGALGIVLCLFLRTSLSMVNFVLFLSLYAVSLVVISIHLMIYRYYRCILAAFHRNDADVFGFVFVFVGCLFCLLLLPHSAS